MSETGVAAAVASGNLGLKGVIAGMLLSFSPSFSRRTPMLPPPLPLPSSPSTFDTCQEIVRGGNPFSESAHSGKSYDGTSDGSCDYAKLHMYLCIYVFTS